MSTTRWVSVTQSNPCPVCHKTNWCRVTADRALAACRHVEAGCWKSKTDKNGATVYLHRLLTDSLSGAEIPPPPGPEARRADSDTLHEVYSALTDRLKLSEAHREALRRRGLTDHAIDAAGYRTLPGQGRSRTVRDFRERFGDKLMRVPGFVVKESKAGRYLTLRGPAGLLVPCRDRTGRIVALKVRRDEAGEADPRYLYVSSVGYGGPSPGAPVHCPAGTPTTAERVRLTEGEIKADVVQGLTALPTISIPGVANWKLALQVLKGMGCKTVQLALDADAADKPTVARPLSAFADALLAAGFTVELERWNLADGKGLDDLLANGKEPELLTADAALSAIRDILAAATADEEPAPPDELSALQDVLDTGGAEALFRNKALMQALADLRATDPPGFFAIRAQIEKRVRLRDLDNALRSFQPTTTPSEGTETPPYFEDRGCIHHNVITKEGPVAVALCNFSARIVEDLEHDDGAERTRYLALQGTLPDGSPLARTEVAAQDFARMEWIVPSWGPRAVVNAGMGMKDHLRAALQVLSEDVPRRTIYRHTGWRKIGEQWVYLHAGGAIGPNGPVEGIPVSLPDALAGFHLPAPPEGAQLAGAIRASLGLLRLGPDWETFPLLACGYRVVLGDTDFALHLAGPTGCFKSEAAALAQQHFGAGMDARHLPANPDCAPGICDKSLS